MLIEEKFDFLNSYSFFSLIDIFFANKLNPDTEEEAIFLAYLFFISRNGFVSLLIEKDDIYPKPQDLNSEENLIFLTEKIINGAKKASEKDYIEKGIEKFSNCPIYKYGNYYYLQKNFVFETSIIENLSKLLSQRPNPIFSQDVFFKNLKKESTLFPDQKKAIEHAYENSISFILGGPGSGKTYLVSYLIEMFSLAFNKDAKKIIKIAIAAFTGKATNHLKDVVLKKTSANIEAKTLHLLLDIKERKNKYFGKDKLDFDLIIVDEASMIDIRLFAYLLDALKSKTRIIFIGDPHQLPPIEGGNIFSELVSLKIFKMVYLKKSVRFENDLILNLAGNVKNENAKELKKVLKKIDFLDLGSNTNIKKVMFNKANEYFFAFSNKKLDVEELLEKINKFRILSSMKTGFWGVDLLNKEIFTFFYKKAKVNQYLYIPIIITKNHYQLNLFNGEMGILEYKIGSDCEKTAYFKIDKVIKRYSIYLIRSYESAYVVSIHKSQGSEFESAMIIIPQNIQYFGKELFYTAITRVKKQITLISSEDLLFQLVKKSSFKNSALSERLIAF
jgi:exodeoxyribonuclease V alpha subunit